ncbi:MAG: arylsulfatase [Opitutales bacterium]
MGQLTVRASIMKLKPILAIILSAASAALLCACERSEGPVDAAVPEKPNILFILTDDLGYGDLSSYGQEDFQTPAIDSLAEGGIRFTDTYAGNTVCAPSRDALMTGRRPGHLTLRNNGEYTLKPGDTTVATLLKQAGYRTALIGKSTVTGNTQTPETLAEHGFEYFFGTTHHVDGHYRYPEFVYENTRKVEFPDNHLHHGSHYDLDLYTEKALGYLDQQSEGNDPFFLVLSVPVPHAAIVVPEDSMAKVREDVQPDPRVAPPPEQPHYTHVTEPKTSYAGLVTRIDESVGSVIDKLRENGQLENTLVVFTSDNGPHSEGGYHPDMLHSNGPLRGHKRDLYEGGIRVPFIAHWPDVIEAGRESDHPSAFWDFLPTATEIAGVRAPEDIQGLSLLPTLTGEGEQTAHDFLYWEFNQKGGRRAIRMGEWKAVEYRLNLGDRRGPVELYNLEDDIGESNDLAAEHPDLVAELTAKMEGARVPSETFPFPGLDPDE